MNRSDSGLLGLPSFVWRLILAGAVLLALAVQKSSAAQCGCESATCQHVVVAEPPTNSWVFRPSRYTHDPATGARVSQYDALPAVEPLDDPRLVTSGYSRSRIVQRGPNGTVDTSYRVTSYGNGRGGLDAEWERFHDAWRGSTVGGGAYSGFFPGFYGGYPPYPVPYGGGGGNGHPGYGPGYGYGPGAGFWPGYGGFSPADRPPLQGPIDPDGADGYEERPRRPFRQTWPWQGSGAGGSAPGGRPSFRPPPRSTTG